MGAEPGARGLLAIFAHPDDETFGAGGSMALAAERGRDVWVICTTNGDEGGKADDGGDHSMDPEIRRDELRCACATLGIHEPIFLDYRDSGMENWTPKPGAFVLVDREEVIERLVDEIRRLRPGAIVTFDPGGIYGHPDHRRVSDVATEAYRRTSREPGGPTALYHHALARSWAERMIQIWSGGADDPEAAEAAAPTEDDLIQRQRLLELARPDEDITTSIDVRAVLERKQAAFRCHASQVRPEDEQRREAEAFEEAMGVEIFVRVDPPPEPGEAETWFQGLGAL